MNLARFLLPSLALLAPASALADAKTYAAASCRANTTSVQITGGTVYNSSTSSQYIWCPIVRDDTAGSISNAWISVYDHTTSGSITCNLYSRDPTSASTAYTAAGTSSSSTGWYTLSYSSISNISNGNLYFYCSLPGATGSSYSFASNYYLDE